MTPDKLAYVSFPGDSDWTTAALGVRGDQLSAALAFDSSTVRVFQSPDGGGSWSTYQSVDVSATKGISDLSIGTDGIRVLLLVDESDSNVALGTAYVTNDGGKTWTTKRAPTGGQVGFAGGLFWLIGGVTGQEVYVSTDGAEWSQVSIPLAGDWTAGLPWTLDDSRVVVPTTTHTDGSSLLALWATADGGKSWTEAQSIEAPLTETGVSLAAAGDASGRWIVALADGSKVFSGLLGDAEPKIVSPNGLAENIIQIARLDGKAAAAYGAIGSCPDGKTSCTSTAGIWYTPDDGQTWTRLSP